MCLRVPLSVSVKREGVGGRVGGREGGRERGLIPYALAAQGLAVEVATHKGYETALKKAGKPIPPATAL